MAKRSVNLRFDHNGGVTIETKGFEGTDCLAETLALEEALGVKVSDDNTSEMYNNPVGVTHSLKQRG